MKIYTSIAIGLLSSFCLLTSCKKESLLTYNVPDNIYFNFKATTNVITDSTNFSFAIRTELVRDSLFKLPFAVTGAPKDHDRKFNVIVIDSNTTAIAGKHYVLPATFTLLAGRILDSIPVKLIRTTDLQKNGVVLRLALQEGEDFKTNVKTLYSSIAGSVDVVTFKIKISDILTAGNYWTGSMVPYFGAFSVKKVRLINQVTGMPLDYYSTGWLYDLQSSSRLSIYAIEVSHYLSDQKAAGNTIYEGDGVTEMKMGTAYQ